MSGAAALQGLGFGAFGAGGLVGPLVGGHSTFGGGGEWWSAWAMRAK
jgi:hypothetical protein